MAEIEVKARAADFSELSARLAARGVSLSAPLRQDDVIFTNGDTDPKTRNIIRIRTAGGVHILTLKRDREGELDCIEVETEVSDPEATRRILEMMGYAESIRVGKVRQKGRLGEYEICLDQVDGLGSFIEVEKISEEEGAKVQAELMEFLAGLGIPESARVFKGYDTLLDEKRNA